MSGRRLVTVAGHLGSVGGTEAAQLAIFTELAGRGWEIHLLYASRGDYWARWEELAATTTQIRASLPSPSAPVTSTLGTIHGALAGIRARPRAVYVHNAGDVPLALSVATATGSKVVAHLHLPPPFAPARVARPVLAPRRRGDHPLAGHRGPLDRRGAPRAGPVRVIPLGIDVDRFVPLGAAQRAEVRSAIGVGEDETMVLYVGRVERIKGAHFLLEAVGRLSEPVHVVVCGAANDEAYLAELVAMDGRSSFLGRRSDVPALMAAADLVAMPSNWLETQGLVLGEAMACGTPVVASDVGGLSATLRGFPDQLVPPADPGRLAAAIERFGHWRRTEPDLGARSRQWVVEHLSLVASVDAIEAVLIGADRRGAPDGPR